MHFNSQFSLLARLPLYIYIYTYTQPFMSSHIKHTQTKNDVIYLQSFDDTYLTLTLLFHLILTRISWLKPRKGSLHFLLSGNNNYNFYVKVGRCGFVDFVNDVIDCECLECIFCFRIKEKEKDTFYINFYSIIIILQSCIYIYIYIYFSFFQLNNYNGYV